jgi:hypothetical protein
MRYFPFIGLFNGAPNLARSSEEILCGGVRQALILILTAGAGVDAQRHGAGPVETWMLGTQVGRSADYVSVAQFDLLNWVSGAANKGSTRGLRTVFRRVPCTIAA